MNKMKKLLSILLCLCMVVSYVPATVFAVTEDNLCDHHTKHTADCGYVAAVAGSDCTHDCGEDCAEGCVHTHDDACGYVAAVQGHACEYVCADCASVGDGSSVPDDAQEDGGTGNPSPTVCTCGTDDDTVHATFCPLYTAPENPVCYCSEHCTADTLNVWCDVCGVDYTACTGSDTASAYDDSTSGGEDEDDTSVTLYFDNTDGWSTVNAYYWSNSNQQMTSWPGMAMTKVEGSIYSIEVPSDVTYIIFNNGGSSQTADLTIPTDGSNLYTYGTSSWSTYTPGDSGDSGDSGGGDSDTMTLYFDNTDGWSTVNAYYWSNSNQQMTSWPGMAMTKVEGNIYSIEVPADATYIIFNNNGSNQTDALTIPTDGSNLYTYSPSGWSTYTPGSSGGDDTTTGITTIAELNAALEKGGTVTLTQNITDTDGSRIYFDSSVTAVLDLNGYSLNLNGVFSIYNFDSTLTITDSSAAGSGGIYNSTSVAIYSSGTLTIEGGSYTNGIYFFMTGNAGTITVTGGTFNGTIGNGTVSGLTIQGGTFTDDPSKYVDTTAYTVQESTENGVTVYTVVEGVEATPATITTHPTAIEGLTYTGYLGYTLVTAGTAEGGTMYYKLGEYGGWSTDLPTAVNAGTYTVYYYAKGDGNHADSEVYSLEAAIAPKALPNMALEENTVVWNGEVQTPILSANSLTKDEDYTIKWDKEGFTEPGEYTATIEGIGNYTGSCTLTYTIQAAVAKLTVDGSDTYYASFLSALTNAEVYSGSTLTLLDSFSYDSTLYCSGNFTLDLGGKTLTLAGYLVNKGTLVICNGSITVAYYLQNENVLTIENSSITSTLASGYAVYNYTASTVSISNSTLIAGGTGLVNLGTASVSESTVTGGSYGVENSGTLNLSGALTITGTEGADLVVGQSVTITGALTGNDTFTVDGLYDGRKVAIGNGYLTEADVNRFVPTAERYATYYEDGDIYAKWKWFTVTLELTDMWSNRSSPFTVYYGLDVDITLGVDSGYFLPETVTVNDGVDYEYDASTGNLTISNITKDVTITAEATQCDHPEASLSYQQSTTEQHHVTCTQCGVDWYEDHTDFTFSAADATLTATCNDCGADAALTISASDGLYNGTANEATVSGSIPGVETPEIVYTANDGGSLTDGKPVNAGSYTASITLGGQTASVTYEIGKIYASCTVSVVEGLVYNGSPQNLVTCEAVTGGTVMYDITSENHYSDQIPTGEAADTYIVHYYIQGDSNHNSTSPQFLIVTIGERDITGAEIGEFSALTYTGIAQTPNATVTIDGMTVTGAWSKVTNVGQVSTFTASGNFTGTLTADPGMTPITISDDAVHLYGTLTYTGEEQTQNVVVYGGGYTYDVTGNTATDAGTYELTVTGTGNFTGEVKLSWSIAKAQASVTEAPVAAMLTYNGEAQALLTNPGTAQGGTMVYSLTWDGEYTETIPTATGAGDFYVVYYYIKGDKNHEDTEVDRVFAAIAKATPSAPDLPTLYATYGDTLADVELPEGFSWGDPAHKVDGVGTKTYYAYYNPDPDNYNTVEILATIEVKPKEITVTANPVTKTYGDDDPELTYTVSGLEEGDLLYSSLARESGSDVGEYAITQGTLNANSNYTISFTGSTFTIQPGALTVTVNDQTIVYGEQISVAEYRVTGLVLGDAADVILTPSTSNVTTNGTITAIASISNARGDVTSNYAISYTTGKLVIQPDTSAIDGLTTDNVTSADTADIEAVQKMLEDADSVAEEWNEISELCEALLEKIAAVDAENVRLREAADSYSLGTVKSSDEEAITQLLYEIEAQLATNNLTDDERAGLEGLETKCENLLAKIEGTEALIDQLDKTVSDMDAETVKSTDKAALEQVIADAQELIHNNNVTDAEREALEQIAADAEKLIQVIDSIAEEVEEVTEQTATFDEETVTSADQEDLEQLAEDIEALLDTDNLTDKERADLEDLLDEIDNFLEIIEDTANNSKYATDTIQNLDAETVNSGDKTELEDALATIDELLSGDNLTEEERESLEEAKEKAENLLDIIDAAASATDTENTEKTQNVTSENVKPEDKEALEDAKADLEKALEENESNYTEDEKQAIRDEIQRIEDALEVLENVEEVTESVESLPETVEPDDEETAKKILDAKAGYDALTDYEKSLVDAATKKKLDDLVASLTAYKIIEGDGSKWTKDSGKTLSFTANGPYGKFRGIEIDGEKVSILYYTAKSGSTVITLRASYLQKLSTGKHTITVLYSDGEAEGTFTIVAAASNSATGDDFHVEMWGSVMSICALAMILLIAESKRRSLKK